MADGGGDDTELRQQGVVPEYTLDQVEDDEPKAELTTTKLWPDDATTDSFRQQCPRVLIGGSAFGKGIFTDDDALQSTQPYRVVRLAFKYGIRAIDTSPFYHPSEISLGRILSCLRPEYPRSSYFLQTKVGRYGQTVKDFDYSPKRVRQSVEESLRRLGTTYLDSVVMHDVEFVAHSVGPSQQAGFAARDLLDDAAVRRSCGIALDGKDDADECARVPAIVHGPGDEAVLDAVRTLFALKDQGLVRNVGIGGYPLPTLLRLSRLIATSAPFRPVDVIVSYSHHTLQNNLLARYADLFAQEPKEARKRAMAEHQLADSSSAWTAPMMINASPFSMGLLTDKGPPEWHPASAELRRSTIAASAHLDSRLASVAARFGLSALDGKGETNTIIGMNTVEQVHQAVETLRAIQHVAGANDEEKFVIDTFRSANVLDWCWASP